MKELIEDLIARGYSIDLSPTLDEAGEKVCRTELTHRERELGLYVANNNDIQDSLRRMEYLLEQQYQFNTGTFTGLALDKDCNFVEYVNSQLVQPK